MVTVPIVLMAWAFVEAHRAAKRQDLATVALFVALGAVCALAMATQWIAAAIVSLQPS